MTDTTNIGRRSFLKRSAIMGGATVGGALAAPAVLAQAPMVIKMQTSWGDAEHLAGIRPGLRRPASRRCRAAG